jgi:hypothetical protein
MIVFDFEMRYDLRCPTFSEVDITRSLTESIDIKLKQSAKRGERWSRHSYLKKDDETRPKRCLYK